MAEDAMKHDTTKEEADQSLQSPLVAAQVPEIAASAPAPAPAAGPSSHKKKARKGPSGPVLPLDEVLLRRVTTIREGDNVLLRLPSDAVKAIVASQSGLVQLGKFGAFPASQLIGLPYDITYEIYPLAASASALAVPTSPSSSNDRAFGQQQKKRKKGKGDGEGGGGGGKDSNALGWKNGLRPLRRQPIAELVIDDITETNEFIDDTDLKEGQLTSDEINELRAQGLTAEEIIEKQMERHERFGMKTEFSKEKWRKKKEKKFYQTITPLSPSSRNITLHYAQRAPASILHLRDDTLAQLLLSANVRPGGRYLVVDDTGGLLTAAIMERMGCEGRIMLFTETDSPPGWGVLNIMNFGQRELACVKWLNWMEAEEEYQRPLPPDEDDLPSIAVQKTLNRLRRHNNQVADLNANRDELHLGSWDGLILATELSPTSILARLTPYLSGSSQIVVYSPYLQVLSDVLLYAKKQPEYLGPTLTEAWSRTYQVLPGRTHPLMTTSATGGYLFHATRVHPSAFQAESSQRNRRKKGAKGGDAKGVNSEEAISGDGAGSSARDLVAGPAEEEHEENGDEDEVNQVVGAE